MAWTLGKKELTSNFGKAFLLMLCQRCQAHQATRQWVDGYGHSHALCELCATQAAVFGKLQNMMMPALMQHCQPAVLGCPTCGLTWQQLNQLSHLGCPECYRHFRLAVAGTLNRLHGQATHSGRRPKARRLAGQEKVTKEWVRDQLEQCLAEERYEEAAKWRDRLRQWTDEA